MNIENIEQATAIAAVPVRSISATGRLPYWSTRKNVKFWLNSVQDLQRRRAIEALEARASPPDSVATEPSKKYHSVHKFERKQWENSPCDAMHSD